MTLYEIIKALQDAPKKGGHKLAILEQHKSNTVLQAYLKLVYDPRVTFGIAKVPKFKKSLPHGGGSLIEDRLEDLNPLIERSLTGSKATEHLTKLFQRDSFEGQELLTYTVKRDICADVGEGTILKVWPTLFFIPPYQRCAKMTDKLKAQFAKLPYFYVQTKSDGQFSYLISPFKGVPESMSRAGSLYPSWLPAKLAEGLPKGFVLAGEMLVYKNGVMLDRKTGNGILNSILSGDGSKFDASTMRVEYVAWDMLTESEFKCGRSLRLYEDRLAALAEMLKAAKLEHIKLTRTWRVGSIAEAATIQNEHLARGEEGTVWKSPILEWRDCSSGDPLMVKAKLVFQADFEIEGAYEGEGNAAGTLGGFNMKTRDGLIKFNVGSGFDAAQRIDYWKMLLENGMDCFNGTVAAIEGNAIETSKSKDTESIFLPIFIEIRLDKKIADSRDEVWAEYNAARGM